MFKIWNNYVVKLLEGLFSFYFTLILLIAAYFQEIWKPLCETEIEIIDHLLYIIGYVCSVTGSVCMQAGNFEMTATLYKIAVNQLHKCQQVLICKTLKIIHIVLPNKDALSALLGQCRITTL